MLTGIHLLLTYMCNFTCDHCFWYSGPDAKGTFTLRELRETISEIARIGTVEWVYFEGGEPFLFFPLMMEGLTMARGIGLKTGIISNAYWGTSREDAALWLKPLRDLEISDLSISDDVFHHDGKAENPATLAAGAARDLGLPVGTLCIEKPWIDTSVKNDLNSEKPAIGGGVLFRGRAVEKLTAPLPKREWKTLTRCPYEDLNDPDRIHIDPYGNVHLCQGLSMGNMRQAPLSNLVQRYSALSHPICGPLVRGGPALLAKEYGVDHEGKYVDECHFCYSVRLALIPRFPQYLTPMQVYGLE